MVNFPEVSFPEVSFPEVNVAAPNSTADEDAVGEETQDVSVDTVKANHSADDQMDQEVSEEDRMTDDPMLINEEVF